MNKLQLYIALFGCFGIVSCQMNDDSQRKSDEIIEEVVERFEDGSPYIVNSYRNDLDSDSLILIKITKYFNDGAISDVDNRELRMLVGRYPDGRIYTVSYYDGGGEVIFDDENKIHRAGNRRLPNILCGDWVLWDYDGYIDTVMHYEEGHNLTPNWSDSALMEKNFGSKFKISNSNPH